MAHIPMDDIHLLWRETRQHTWPAFRQTLQAHKGKVDGISDALIDLMLKMSEDFERSGQPFPSTPQQLFEVLNQQLQRIGAK